MSETPKDWPATVALPGSVSSGTLNPRDLIPAFVDVLKYLRPRKNIELAMQYSRWVREPDSELASEYLMALIEALEEAAPEGYYFGAIEGDGSDFGFWEVDADDLEPEERGAYQRPDEDMPDSNEVVAAKGMIRLYELIAAADNNPEALVELDAADFRDAYVSAMEVLHARED